MSDIGTLLCGAPPKGGKAPGGPLEFVRLKAEHIFALDLQDSQRLQYGVDPLDMEWAQAEHYAQQASSWTAMRGDQVMACFGVVETFPDVQGVAWALLGKGLGRDHHRLTRFARDEVIGKCPFRRLEAIVRCADVDAITETEWSWNDAAVRLAIALGEPTPQVRWAIAVGLTPVAVLRKFGAASEPHMLLERIR